MKLPRLREWRERRGLTQAELSQRSGTNPTTISRIEGGKRGAHPSTARKLAEALGVEIDDLKSPGYPGVREMMRLRSEAKEQGAEFMVEEMEQRLRMEEDPTYRELLRTTAEEFALKARRERGEYAGDSVGYLKDRVRVELLDLRVLLVQAQLLAETAGEVPEQLLDRVEEKMEEYRRARRASQDS
jgi:transcriptional regulator with XRE-family HTH domain